MFLATAFTSIIYQPFFNVLIAVYWVLGLGGRTPDMGIAVIVLTLLIRLLLLPITLASDSSEEERREIAAKVAALETEFAGDPIAQEIHKKKIFKTNFRVLLAELFSLFIQVSIALMLWRMFDTGLSGEDLHLIYPFMPTVATPFNLHFLGKIDLTHSSVWLNILQSLAIFVVETVGMLTSPFPHHRGEVVRMQLILPLVSFVIFMKLPAGKKLFVITTLLVSLVIIVFKAVRRRFLQYSERVAAEEAAAASEAQTEQILVDFKT